MIRGVFPFREGKGPGARTVAGRRIPQLPEVVVAPTPQDARLIARDPVFVPSPEESNFFQAEGLNWNGRGVSGPIPQLSPVISSPGKNASISLRGKAEACPGGDSRDGPTQGNDAGAKPSALPDQTQLPFTPVTPPPQDSPGRQRQPVSGSGSDYANTSQPLNLRGRWNQAEFSPPDLEVTVIPPSPNSAIPTQRESVMPAAHNLGDPVKPFDFGPGRYVSSRSDTELAVVIPPAGEHPAVFAEEERMIFPCGERFYGHARRRVRQKRHWAIQVRAIPELPMTVEAPSPHPPIGAQGERVVPPRRDDYLCRGWLSFKAVES